ARDFPSNSQYRREIANALRSISVASERRDDAIEYAKRAIVAQKHVVDGDPRNVSFRSELISLQEHLANILDQYGNPQEAMESLREALAGADRLLTEHASFADGQFRRASVLRTMGMVESLTGDLKTAISFQRQAQMLMEALVRRYPEREMYSSTLAFL